MPSGHFDHRTQYVRGMARKVEVKWTPALQDVHDRALVAGLGAELGFVDEEEQEFEYVRVEFKEGRSKRSITLDEDEVGALDGVDLGGLVFLSKFDAFANRATGTVEGVISSPVAHRMSSVRIRQLSQLPGVEVLSESIAQTHADALEEEPFNPYDSARKPPEKWRLRVQSGTNAGVAVEIGSASRLADAFFSGRVSVRIEGADISTYESALEALHRYGNAFLFELDLVYDIPVRLVTRRPYVRRRKNKGPERPPSFPRNRYAQQSLALYEYGRSAVNLPLLEFLAYYQSVEYFFPYFAREQILNSLRSTLLHPRFDPSDDAELARVIDLAGNGGRSSIPERDQLRATIRACLSEPDLSNFLAQDQARTDYFFASKQALRGVRPLRRGAGADDVRDQIADRMYAIRCRIVHAKQDGGPSNVDVLLPLSEEADAMTPEIELMRLVAQQVLVGRAARN